MRHDVGVRRADCFSVNADPERSLGLLGHLLDGIDGSAVPGAHPVVGTSWVAARSGMTTEAPAA